MKVTFLGTRGNVDLRTERHGMHSSLMIETEEGRVIVDWGVDWTGRLQDYAPDAVAVTHAHPDHAWGLKTGANCPVYATVATWREMERYPIEERHVVTPGDPFAICGLRFEAFAIEHSIRAPAVGYRIGTGKATFFYSPDVAWIPERATALAGLDLYVGDGATIKRSMVRRKGERLYGHAAIQTQLTWCANEGVPRSIFTHCGSAVVRGDPGDAVAEVEQLAEERGVAVAVARDGLELELG